MLGLAASCIRLNPRASAAAVAPAAPIRGVETGQGRVSVGAEKHDTVASAQIELLPGGRAMVTFYDKGTPLAFLGTWSADPKDLCDVTLEILGGHGAAPKGRGKVRLREPEGGFLAVAFEGADPARALSASFTSSTPAAVAAAAPAVPEAVRAKPVRELEAIETGTGQMTRGKGVTAVSRVSLALKPAGEAEILVLGGTLPVRLLGGWGRNPKDPREVVLRITDSVEGQSISARGQARLAGEGFASVRLEGNEGREAFTLQFTSGRAASR